MCPIATWTLHVAILIIPQDRAGSGGRSGHIGPLECLSVLALKEVQLQYEFMILGIPIGEEPALAFVHWDIRNLQCDSNSMDTISQ